VTDPFVSASAAESQVIERRFTTQLG